MSEEQTTSSPTPDARGGPGGGGGKSLALMQQRLLSNPQAQAEVAATAPAPASTDVSPPAGRPGKSAAQLLAAQAKQATSAASMTKPTAQNRPKGKDFATMAMHAAAPKPTATTPSPTPVAPSAPNRPKGKDFAAMANRMVASSPPVPAQHSPTSAFAEARAHAEAQDPGRAARMQAAARAAAGLPPLQVPTATSVSTIPPPIIAPVQVPAPRAVPAPALGPTVAAYKAQQGSAVANAEELQRQQHFKQHLLKMKETQMTTVRPPPPARRTSSGSSSSKLAATQAAAAVPAPPPAPPKPTPQPSLGEARLAAATALVGTGGPHVAPLIGQRLSDLVSSLDPNYALDAQAEEQVLQLADDFLDKVTRQGIRLAHHRGSKTVDVQDIQLALSKQWGIVVPGLGAPTLRPSKPGSRVAASSSGIKRRASESKGTSRAKKPSTPKSAPSNSTPVSTT